jgi:myo-inositol-1(or 4)-monophosphatase
MTVPQPEELLALAVTVTRDGGALAMAKRSEFLTDVRTKSTKTDVVTAADVAVERFIIDALRAKRPDDSFFGEESGGDESGGADSRGAESGGQESGGQESGGQESGGRVRWILDPIDGTVNYLYGIPYFAVSLAAEVNGEVVAGVVRNPASGEVWTAVRGGGAYWGDQRIHGGPATDLSLALIATGFGYDAGRRARQAAVFAGLAEQVRDIRRLGAGALDLCLAASGLVDAFYEKGLSEWDWAAGALIATEAGLRVSGLRGRPMGPEFVLAAPPAIYGALHDVLVELGADEGP